MFIQMLTYPFVLRNFNKEYVLFSVAVTSKLIYYILVAAVDVLLFLHCKVPVTSGDTNTSGILPDRIDFNFHVKPILSDCCFACHGPDAITREVVLLLDLEETA